MKQKKFEEVCVIRKSCLALVAACYDFVLSFFSVQIDGYLFPACFVDQVRSNRTGRAEERQLAVFSIASES